MDAIIMIFIGGTAQNGRKMHLLVAIALAIQNARQEFA